MPLRDSYADHIQTLDRRYGEILRTLAAAGSEYEGLVFHAGSEILYHADDQPVPFRPVPHFARWAPLKGSDHLLVFEPGRVAEIGLCSCPTCAQLGTGRIRDALVETLGADIGGVSPDGSVRFVAADCGGESRDEPLLTLDGQSQPGMTADKARTLAESLRAKAAKAARA